MLHKLMKIYRRTGRAVEKKNPERNREDIGNKNGAENDVNDRIREKEREMKKAAYGNGTAYIGNSETEESATTKNAGAGTLTTLQKGEIFAGIVAIVLIFAVTLTNILLPDREFSEKENRMLAEKPEISASSLLDGRFMKHSESYLADQFMARDFWISLRSRFQLLMGSSDSNGVYRGARGYLFQQESEPDEEHLKANVEAINQLAENTDLRIFMMVVPTASNVLEEYMPKFAPESQQNKNLEELKKSISSNINFIDSYETLKEHESEYIYYYTDHHWTTKGAYYAFLNAAPSLGIPNPDEIKYERYAVTDSFAGTLASKSGFPLKEKDTIEIWVPETDAEQLDAAESSESEESAAFKSSVSYIVEYVQEDRKSAVLYDSEKLESTDKYAVFFGGNYPLIRITTANDTGKDGPLLILKDSYANCFVPFLLPYFDEIIMVDPRYYYDNLQELIKTEGISQILFLYNADTFFEDTSLADVLAVGETQEE